MYFLKNRKQNRMPAFDYSSVGYYFVTICTQDRELFFGNVEHGEMIVSEMGKIAVDCWNEIPDHFDNIVLDEFVVMPNHVHGIILITENRQNDDVTVDVIVGGRHACPLQSPQQNEQPLSITRPHELLPVVIGSYKSAVTKLIHRLPAENDHTKIDINTVENRHTCFLSIFGLQNMPKYFGWQRSYHDSIIRDEPSLYRIRAYIKNNPANWMQDKNYRK
jgi:REP element-mobilizing transposase RayT